jgi:hypothetical protein
MITGTHLAVQLRVDEKHGPAHAPELDHRPQASHLVEIQVLAHVAVPLRERASQSQSQGQSQGSTY